MPLPESLRAVIGWLHAGYPEGVPDRDYIPLIALLSNQLNDEEVGAIADELTNSGDATSASAIRAAIVEYARVQPTQADVARVSARLAAGGWPLAQPNRLSGSS